MAIQSGARGALGSLWPVSDEATQALLPAFYRALQQPGVSKAQALQRAQLGLLHGELALHPLEEGLSTEDNARLATELQRLFRHPFFWSAFILVGNWQ